MRSRHLIILIVEDEVIIALQTARILQGEGYTVVTAKNGEEAIAAVESSSSPIDLVLMDIDLGQGMDGTEAARRILAIKDIPVLFLSSHTEKEIVDRTEAITSYGYVVKNSGTTVLLASIKMAMKLHAAHQAIIVKTNELQNANEALNRTIEELESTNEELMRAEEELHRKSNELLESREEFRGYFNMSTVGMCITSTEKGWIEVNRRLTEMLGYSREELTALTWAELTHPDDLAADVAQFERMLAGEIDEYDMEKRFIRKDGGVITVMLYVTCKRRTDGTVQHLQASLVDITDRKRAEEELHLSERRNAHLVKNSIDIIVILDADGTQRFVSDSCERILGYRPEELTDIDVIAEMIHPDDIASTRAAFEAIIATGRGGARYRHRHRDGRWVYLEGWGVNLLDEPAVRGVMVNVRDATAQVEAEVRLGERIKELRCLYAVAREIEENLPLGDIIQAIIGHIPPAFFHPELTVARITLDGTTYRTGDAWRGPAVLEVPIVVHGAVFGSLAVNVLDADMAVFLPEERDLVEAIAERLGRMIERRQAEERLALTAERLELATRAGRLGTWDWDITRNVLTWDDGMYELYGVGREDFAGAYEAWLACIHPDDRERSETISLRARRGEIAYDTEFRIRRPDGAVRIIKANGLITRDESGAALRMTGVNLDITEQRRIEEGLRVSGEQLRKKVTEVEELLRASRAVLSNRDFTTAARIIFDACRGLTGATAGYVALLNDRGDENEVLFLEAGGRPCSVDPSLPMPIRGLREVAYREGRTVYDNAFSESAWQEFLPAGHVRLDNVMFAPLVIDGSVQGILGVANKAGGFTDDDVRMATAFGDIAAVALMNSRNTDRLESSLREKEILMRELQHRVKNSMSIISSLMGIEADTLQDDHARGVLVKMQSRIASMATLYELLYGSSRYGTVPLRDYLTTLVSSIHQTFTKGLHDLRIALALEEVEVDMRQALPVGLVVNELLTNAIKYAYPPGSPGEIRVDLARQGDTLVLIVADDGRGLPHDLVPAETTSTGMKLVHLLAIQIGGRVSFEAGKGTTARLTFTPW